MPPARRRALLASLLFLVAGVAGVLGNKVTGQVSWTLIALAGTLCIGAGIVYGLERLNGSEDHSQQAESRQFAGGVSASGPGSVAAGINKGSITTTTIDPSGEPDGAASDGT